MVLVSLFLKKYDTGKSEYENKIHDTNSLFKKINYDANIVDIEGKIPDVSNLATKNCINYCWK